VNDAAPTGGAHAKATSKGAMISSSLFVLTLFPHPRPFSCLPITGIVNVRRRLCGLQILLCLLKANYPLFEDRGTIEEKSCAQEILRQTCNGCKFPRKEVYEQSAAVCGAILQSITLANANNSTNQRDARSRPTSLLSETSKYAKDVEMKLNSIYSSVKNGCDVVATCLRSISRYCPSFLTRELLLKMFASFGILKSKSRGDFLEVLCLSTGEEARRGREGVANERSKFDGISVLENMKAYLPSLLNDVSTVAYGRGNSLRNLPHIQILTLRLLRVHSSEFVRQNILLSLLSSDGNGGGQSGGGGGSSSSSSSVGLLKIVNEVTLLEVRQEAFAMLMALHVELTKQIATEITSAALSAQNYANFQIQLGIVRVLLLRGLTDSDDEGMQGTEEAALTLTDSSQHFTLRIGIRKTIFEFFEAHFGMSSCPVSRLTTLLTDLFDPISVAISSSMIRRVEEDGENIDHLPTALTGITVSDQWLRYSAYLLLGACKNDDANGLQKKLFPRGLAADDSFAPVQVSLLLSLVFLTRFLFPLR
jgi:hypothetical protein